MKQQLRKPENWQDFEELCKVLWGEVWDCPEIKKNGRAGQNQKGVDIYGVAKGEIKYYGIQCKGKDEYVKATLSESEIDQEIEKAKLFKPALKKFYFATTANKDEKIEEYIRIKNVEHLEGSLFEVHLFSWEDITYLIDQNRRTHDWYVKKIDFSSSFNIKVSFDNNEIIKEFQPVLLKNYIRYTYSKPNNSFRDYRFATSSEERRKDKLKIDTEAQPVRYFMNGETYNKSSCVFVIKLSNIGNSQLDNWKLYVNFEDDVFTSEIVYKQTGFLDMVKRDYNIKWVKGTNDLEFKSNDSALVQNDYVFSDKICLRPSAENPVCILLNWKLVAKDFTETGQLKVVLNTSIKQKNTIKVSDLILEDEVVLQNYTGKLDS